MHARPIIIGSDVWEGEGDIPPYRVGCPGGHASYTGPLTLRIINKLIVFALQICLFKTFTDKLKLCKIVR